MARGGKVRVDIDGDHSGLTRATAGAERDLNRLHRSGSRALNGLKLAGIATGAALGVGLAAAVVTGTRELLEQEKASAQTAAALESTGKAAGVTKKQIEDLSQALQNQTGVADDAIQSSQNLLLTFTSIENQAGRNNAIFTRATKAALDLSVAFHKDLNSSTVLVGKALNDPIRGLTSLTRVGVQFTDQQKEQIKTLTESGRKLDAQKIILRELNREVGGSAKALGETTAGQLSRIRRAWEDISESLVVAFLPIFTRMARTVLNNMPTIQKAFRGLATGIAETAKFIGDLATGNWAVVWRKIKTVADLAMKALAPLIRRAGTAIGQALVGGIASGIDSALRSVPGGAAIARFMGLGASGNIGVGGMLSAQAFAGIAAQAESYAPTPGPARNPRGGRPIDRASGGYVPGRFDARDDVPVNLSRGEVVLNPSQQRIVGIDRIMGALRSTGGVVIGGGRFATGGIVAAAEQRARSNLNEPYSTPGRLGPNSWDCSSYAAMVAGFPASLTTASAYPLTTAARGGEPIVWGFRNNSRTTGSYPSGNNSHMGVRVSGVWYQTSGGRTAQTGSDGDWMEIRVPRGLENLANEVDTEANTRGTGRPQLSPAMRISNLFAKAFGLKPGAGPGPTSATVQRALPGVRDVSEGLAGASLTERESRAAGGAGRAASAAARKAGLSPEAVAAAGSEAERQAEIKFLNKHLGKAREELGILASKKRTLLADYQRIGRTKAKTPAAAAAKRKLMKANRIKRAAITAEMNDVRDVIEDIRASLAEIDEQAAAERYQIDYDLGQEAANAAQGAESGTGAEAGISADAQAQIDQANTRAATAQRGQGLAEGFARVLFGSPSIDPGAGATVVNNVYIQSITPGDPQIKTEVANWIVGALGTQGGVPSSAFSAGV